MSALVLLLGSVCYTASAGVRVDPDLPPAVERVDAHTLAIHFPHVEAPVLARDATVVTLRRGAEPPARLRAEGRPIGRAARHWVVEGTPAEDGLAIALRWLEHPDVEDAIPDLYVPKTRAEFDDPVYGGQWYLEELEMEQLYEVTLGDPSVVIAVIDSAVDTDHPDLADAVVAPLDVVDGDDDPRPVPGQECEPGVDDLCDTHGTSVSGIVAARAGNAIGIVGMCPECSLVPIRLLGPNAPLSSDVAAFEHAIEQDAAVINNSWGFTDAIAVPLALAEVIDRAATETRGGLGSVVVFAAGNDDREVERDEMAALRSVLCVSAVDSYGLPTAFTNYGKPIDVAAPSATVTLAPGGGTTETFGGTSAAAPVAAGLAAWILSYDPSLSSAEVVDLLIDTAHKTSIVTFNDKGHHDVYGYGEIDPPAVLAALTGSGVVDPIGEPAPKGCGCVSSGPVGGGASGAAAVWSAAAALLWRRRRP